MMRSLSKAEKSQTSIVPMVPPTLYRLRFAGRQRRVVREVREVPEVSAAGGIAAVAVARAAAVAAEVVGRNNSL